MTYIPPYLGSLHLAKITQLKGDYNPPLQRHCLLYNFEPSLVGIEARYTGGRLGRLTYLVGPYRQTYVDARNVLLGDY